MIRLLVISALVSFLHTPLAGQTVRYLEKRNYEQEDAAYQVVSMPTVSPDFSRLAFASYRIEVTKDQKQMRMLNTSKILNLKTGRLEMNMPGINLGYVSNYLMYKDLSPAMEWTPTSELAAKLSNLPMYTFNPDSNEKRLFFDIPAGYQFLNIIGKYVLLMSTNFSKPSSALAENVDGKLFIRHTFPFIGNFSGDSTKVTGTIAAEKKIVSYDLDGNVVSSFQVDPAPISTRLLRDGNWICVSYNSSATPPGHIAKLLSPDSKRVIAEFRTQMMFDLTKSEKELVYADPDGTIRMIEVATGRTLAAVKDTYIKIDPAGSSLTTPKKSVNMMVMKVKGGEFFLVPYSTGIMSLFSTKEKAVVANIFTDMDDWAVIARDGRVDGTAGAFEKLEWREYNGDKIVAQTSLESMFDKYYTPRLLYSILNESGTAENLTISGEMRLAPSLRLTKINNTDPPVAVAGVTQYSAQAKNMTISLKAEANAGTVKEVRLYHNGKLVGLQPGNPSALYEFKVTLNSVFGEMNTVYAVASTDKGIDSEKMKLVVSYKATENVKPKLFVMVVGINKYLNPKYQLNYALPDAGAIKKYFNTGTNQLFESTVVRSLFDAEATKAGIVRAFGELKETMGEQDLFIFYYAGHGTMGDGPASQQFYIVPYDVTQLYGNEAILKEKAISANEMRELSAGLRAQKQVFIIDACHAAGALETVATRGATEERAIGQLARSTGTFWLTAAGSDQFATELEKLGHGVFTFSLLEALQGKDAGSATDGTITIRELSSYVEQRVPELSLKYKGSPQYPASFSFGNDFPIATSTVK